MPGKIDFTKPVQVRDKRNWRLYATDGSPDWPIHGAVDVNGRWEAIAWATDGASCTYKNLDLISAPPRIKRTVFLNVYPTGDVVPHNSRLEADTECLDNRIACVEFQIDVQEGHGL